MKNIKNILKKDGLSDSEIEKMICNIKDIKTGQSLQLSKNHTFTLIDLKKTIPCIESPIFDERAACLMAYEFLAIYIGINIFGAEFNPFRQYILEGKKTNDLIIESGRFKCCEPRHIIYPEFLKDRVIINIILFGRILYKVDFLISGYVRQDAVIMIDLINNETLIAKSLSDAKKNLFCHLS